MKQLLTLFILSLCLVLSVSCNSKEKSTGNEEKLTEEKVSESSGQQSKTFKATGTVTSIPPGKRNIVVKHGDIPGFMDAMTMPFQVKDSTILTGISAKDSIGFTIQIRDKQILVTGIKKLN